MLADTYQNINAQWRDTTIVATGWVRILDVNRHRRNAWIKTLSWDVALLFQTDDPWASTLVTSAALTLDSVTPAWESKQWGSTIYIWAVWGRVATWTWSVEFLDWWINW